MFQEADFERHYVDWIACNTILYVTIKDCFINFVTLNKSQLKIARELKQDTVCGYYSGGVQAHLMLIPFFDCFVGLNNLLNFDIQIT